MVFGMRLQGFKPVTLAFCLLASASAFAQVSSSAATVTLNATLTESLTLTATPGTVNFNLVPGGVATGSTPVTISTSWVLAAGRSAVRLYGWFTSPTAALTDGGSPSNNIPSSMIFGQMANGSPTSYTAFTQSNTLGTVSGGLSLFTQTIGSSTRASNRSDDLNLKIDLTSLPQLPAGSYSGTLTLQVQSL